MSESRQQQEADSKEGKAVAGHPLRWLGQFVNQSADFLVTPLSPLLVVTTGLLALGS